MMRLLITGMVTSWACGCMAEPEQVDTHEQAFMQNQGTQLQGVQLHGPQLQGMRMQGFQLAGATLSGAPLVNLRLDRGELVAELGQVTLRGAALVDAHLIARVRNLAAIPATSALVEYRITGVEAEAAIFDPTQTGATFLYTLEQHVTQTQTWEPACPVDTEGRRAAIPLTATWDERGARVESSSLFTMGCTTGVIAKCYRWGYRPWLTGRGNVTNMHWTCTRVARADYCGNGQSHTRDGTVINVWDNASPAPIQTQGATPPDMLFEAGWNTQGAVCLSHGRWLLGGPLILLGCPGRLIPPSLPILGPTVCDDVAQVLGQAANATMFNESNLNLNLDLL